MNARIKVTLYKTVAIALCYNLYFDTIDLTHKVEAFLNLELSCIHQICENMFW